MKDIRTTGTLMGHKRVQMLRRMIMRGVCCMTGALVCTAPAFAWQQNESPQLQALISSATSAREQGDVPKAIALYQQAVQVDPKWAEGWWYIGSMQYGSNAYSPAMLALSRYIELTPTAGPAFALRGLCEYEEAEYSESLKDLQRAVASGAATQPRNAGIILYHQAILLTKMGSFEQALSSYTEMVKHGDVNQDVAIAIGLAGLRLPMLPKDVEPAQVEAIAAAGQAASAFMGGDLAAAARGFEELFAHYPSTPNLHFFYGYLLFSQDSERAIDQFQKELSVSPESAETHSMLAWAYGLRGDYGSSLLDARQAVEENPNLTIAQLVLGRALVETGDMKAGVQHLLIVLSADPQNLDAHLTLAKAYSRLGRRDEARQERLQCLAITGKGTTSNATM